MTKKIFMIALMLISLYWLLSGMYYTWIQDYPRATLDLLWYLVTWFGVKQNEEI